MRSAVLLTLILMGQMCLADTSSATPHQSIPVRPHAIVIWNTDPDEFPADPLEELAKAVLAHPEVRLFHVGEQSNFGGYHQDGFWYDRSSQRLRYSAFSWRQYGNEHEQRLWSGVTAAKLEDLVQQPYDFDTGRAEAGRLQRDRPLVSPGSRAA